VRHFAVSEKFYRGTTKRQGQLPVEIDPRRKAETMTIKVGDRVRIIANIPHKVGTETISLRGYTRVVRALERYGDRAIVSVEKVSTRSGGTWHQTKLHIRIAAADLEVITNGDGAE
jgi:hypothetical protein